MTNLPIKFGVGSIAMLLCYKKLHKMKLWRIIKEELVELKKKTKPTIKVLLCFSACRDLLQKYIFYRNIF